MLRGVFRSFEEVQVSAATNFVMRMRQGRIVEILEYTDTALAEKVLEPFEQARASSHSHSQAGT